MEDKKQQQVTMTGLATYTHAKRIVVWLHALHIMALQIMAQLPAEDPPAAINSSIGIWNQSKGSTSRMTATTPTLTVSKHISARHKGCWVFHHMVKSGGTTVKGLLYQFQMPVPFPRQEYANRQWLEGIKGQGASEEILLAENGLIYGGYAEGLRKARGGYSDRCKWFTVFRHPLQRLVSAFFYCKRMNRKDPLCAQHVIDLDTIDLRAFAEHWGNYGLLQFVLGFVSIDEVLASPVAQDCENCPGWYLVKQYLESIPSPDSNHTAGDVIPTAPFLTMDDNPSHNVFKLQRFLEPALETISSRYAGVGMLNDIEKTMLLFDKALRMPNFSWMTAYKKQGARNIDGDHKDEEHMALLNASTDPVIKKFIWLDLILYDHAQSVFEKQLKQYGLIDS